MGYYHICISEEAINMCRLYLPGESTGINDYQWELEIQTTTDGS